MTLVKIFTYLDIGYWAALIFLVGFLAVCLRKFWFSYSFSSIIFSHLYTQGYDGLFIFPKTSSYEGGTKYLYESNSLKKLLLNIIQQNIFLFFLSQLIYIIFHRIIFFVWILIMIMCLSSGNGLILMLSNFFLGISGKNCQSNKN